MIEWAGEGIVLAARRHGETSAVVQVFTAEHGRHAGLVRGGAGKRGRGVLQPGNRVAARWRARLADHLGTLVCELVRADGAALLERPDCLAALASACALIERTLGERQPHPGLYDATNALIAALIEAPDWAERYVRWELGLLDELGYGLDLGACAATGATADLAFVSPRSGRAVSRAVGAAYADRLLPLPAFLVGGGGASPAELVAGLALTGAFLERHALAPHDRGLPPARLRLADRFARAATRFGDIVPGAPQDEGSTRNKA